MKKLEKTIQKIKLLDTQLMEETQQRLNNLTKPKGSLGRLEELARKIVGITGKKNPPLKKKVIFTLSSDHGVRLFPQEVTLQMVNNFVRGKAAINVLAKELGMKVIVVDIGVAKDIPSHPDLIIKKIGYGRKKYS